MGIEQQEAQAVWKCEAAHLRNSNLLQDLQQVEDRLRGAQLPRTDLLAMKRMWVSEGMRVWKTYFQNTAPSAVLGPDSQVFIVSLFSMRYWASVEGSLPAWEHFLLGKGPLPAPGPGHLPRRAQQRASTATDQGLPPPAPNTGLLVEREVGGGLPGRYLQWSHDSQITDLLIPS
ncbi:uncharacterized protein C3orf14 homolog [Trematomus bernacchii]|uniref:uncharacterized protein C3orf14 homolog n=1 Tax=Trematomus bernacchii TaxID=40690 RepID=UPI00146B0374|nr:uncharacterized protein C3orf14 homolog [Trematomus bernacchii]